MFTFKVGGETKSLKEVSEKEAPSFTRIGSAEGMDLGHCIYIATRNAKNFFTRCKGYRILKEGVVTAPAPEGGEVREYRVAAEFYE